MNIKKINLKSGLTIAEVLGVLVILAIIVTVKIPKFSGIADQGKVSQAQAVYKQALENERSARDGVIATLEQAWASGLIDKTQAHDTSGMSSTGALTCFVTQTSNSGNTWTGYYVSLVNLAGADAALTGYSSTTITIPSTVPASETFTTQSGQFFPVDGQVLASCVS